MRAKLAVTAAIGVAMMLSAVPGDAQAQTYPSWGWGPVAAGAANALSGAAAYAYAPGYVAAAGYVPATGYGAYAYAPATAVAPAAVAAPAPLAATGYTAYAYDPAQVVAASWYSRGYNALAYAPGQVAVANYGLGMAAGAYCARRFKSYNANTGTFLGRDGQRHPCP